MSQPYPNTNCEDWVIITLEYVFRVGPRSYYPNDVLKERRVLYLTPITPTYIRGPKYTRYNLTRHGCLAHALNSNRTLGVATILMLFYMSTHAIELKSLFGGISCESHKITLNWDAHYTASILHTPREVDITMLRRRLEKLHPILTSGALAHRE